MIESRTRALWPGRSRSFGGGNHRTGELSALPAVREAGLGRQPGDSSPAASSGAAVAVMHSVLVIAYSMLNEKRTYANLGADYFDRLDKTRLQHYYVNRLTSLGHEVTLQPRAA